MNTEELTITIKVDDKDASSKLDELRDKIEKIENLSRSGDFQHLKEVASSLSKIANSATNLGESAKNLKSLGDAANHLAQRVNAIKPDSLKNATSAVRSFGNAMSRLKETGSDKVVNIGPTNAAGIGRATDVARAFWGELKTAYHWGSKVTQLPFKMLFVPLKGAVARVQSLAGAFTGLLSKIGRVAFMRAIRGAIRMVTQALKEGVGAVYDWASAVGDSFVGTMNSISTSLTYFRNSVGAAISPILDAIAPVLDAIVDKCVTVINVFNQLISTLTGASTWRRAEKVAISYGDAASNAAKNTGKANDAAKELRRTLLGFDEINRIDAPDKSSGSGGSGGGGGAGSSGAGALTFTNQPFSDAVENFADMLRDAWDKADFTKIGTIIGEKVGGALLSVPWETKIQPTAAKVATSFGTLLNGMFDYGGSGGKAMWDGIAYTIYGAINTALIARSTFFETVNWTGIGRGIGAALAKVVYNIRWDEVRKNLSAFPNAVIDAVTGFCMQMSPADFHQAGIKIGNAVAGALIDIKWADFFQNGFKIADRLLQALNGIFEGFGSKWGEIKTGIINGIKSVPAEDWAKIGTDIGHLIFNVGNFVANVVDLLVKALEAGHWGRIIGGIWQGIDEKVQATYGGWPGAAAALGKWIVSHLGVVSILLSIAIGNILLTSGTTVVKNMIKNAINGKLGGATGGIVSNGWKSGMLALAATSTLLFEIGMLNTDLKNLNWDDFGKRLAGGLVGAFIGFITGGWTGAAFGFTIGAELTVNFTKIIPKIVSGADNFLFGWLDKIQGNDRSTYTHGIDDDTLNAWGGPLASVNQQTVTNKQDRRYGAPNKVTYGSDTVTKAQTFQVMPDTSNSDKWWKNVQDAWDRIVSAHKASRFHVAGVVNEAQEWWTQTRTFWDNKVSSGATKASRFHVTGVVNESAEWWNQVRTFWSNKVEGGQKASRFHIAGVVNEAGAWWGQTKSFWNNATSGSKLYASVGISGAYNAFVNAWNSMQKNFNNNILTAYVQVKKIGGSVNATYTADGGIYKNGHWQDITRYAAGGTPMSGEIFIAREAGPEMVGTLNGSTAVVNNDQIVNSIADGVFRAASAAFGNGQREPVNDITIKIDSETIYRAVRKGERIANGRYGTVVAIG